MCAFVIAIVGRRSTANCQLLFLLESAGVVTTVLGIHNVLESPRGHMAPWIHCNNLVSISPLWERSNLGSRLSIRKVGSRKNHISNRLQRDFMSRKHMPMISIKFFTGNCQGVIYRVRPSATVSCYCLRYCKLNNALDGLLCCVHN